MFIKFAASDLLQAEIAQPGGRLLKSAHRHSFEYTPRDGYLYVRSRAISSRTNDNFDTFPADEIRSAWRTFIGKPVFVNHHNDDHRRARGVIIDAALHEDTAPDGTPDTWVEVLMEIDAVNFPKLAAAILAEDIERTSMGTDVAYSVCSVCANKASTPSEYCKHIPRLKGKRIRRATASGQGTEDVLVHEICHGLRFFENSVLVEPPADPTAHFLGVDDTGVRSLGMGKTAIATYEELTDKFNLYAAMSMTSEGVEYPGSFGVSFHASSPEKLRSALARFPKWVGFNERGLVNISLTGNGVNGGVNESGLKRARKILEIIGDDEWVIQQPNGPQTRAEMIAAIDLSERITSEEFLKRNTASLPPSTSWRDESGVRSMGADKTAAANDSTYREWTIVKTDTGGRRMGREVLYTGTSPSGRVEVNPTLAGIKAVIDAIEDGTGSSMRDQIARELGFEASVTAVRATRGFPCDFASARLGRRALAMYRRFEAQTATVDDILLLAARNGSVGSQWALEGAWGTGWENHGALDYAYAEELVKDWVEKICGPNPSDDVIWENLEDNLGEVMVILIGDTKAKYIDVEWDADIGSGSKIKLSEIRYNAGWGWVTLPANGRTVTAAKTADLAVQIKDFSPVPPHNFLTGTLGPSVTGYRVISGWDELIDSLERGSYYSEGDYTVRSIEGQTQFSTELSDVLDWFGGGARGKKFTPTAVIEMDLSGLPFRSLHSVDEVQRRSDSVGYIVFNTTGGMGIDGPIPLSRLRKVHVLVNGKIVDTLQGSEISVQAIEQLRDGAMAKAAAMDDGLPWRDEGGVWTLGDADSDSYASVGQPANAGGKWHYRVDTPYGAHIDAGFDTADEAKAAAESVMDDEVRSELTAVAAKTAATDTFTVCRGFQVSIPNRQIAERIKAGRATSQDIMSIVSGNGVGVYWGLLDIDPSKPNWDQWDVSKSKEYAHTDANPWNDYYADFDAGYFGDIGVVLVGESPVAPDDFNLAIPKGTPVTLTEIHYGAFPNNWYRVPVKMTVTASEATITDTEQSMSTNERLAVTASRTAAATPPVTINEYRGDYGVTWRADIDMPGFDYESPLPMKISVDAKEAGSKNWYVSATFGPHNTTDARGSYYHSVSLENFQGTPSAVKAHITREVKRMFNEYMGGQHQRTASRHQGAGLDGEWSNQEEKPELITWDEWEMAGSTNYGLGYEAGKASGTLEEAIDWAGPTDEEAFRRGFSDAQRGLPKSAAAATKCTQGCGRDADGIYVDDSPGGFGSAYCSTCVAEWERKGWGNWEKVRDLNKTAAKASLPTAVAEEGAGIWSASSIGRTRGISVPAGTRAKAVSYFIDRRNDLPVYEWRVDGYGGGWSLRGPWQITSTGSLGDKTAYGEVVAPAAIDTLRIKDCPVCGEDESLDGDGRCRVCGYLPPPEPFRDPDLDIAQKADMRTGPINADLFKAPSFEPPSENPDAMNPVQSRLSPPKGQNQSSQGANMRPTVAAAARQQQIITAQAQRIAQLERKVIALTRRHADAANPAQPVPEPGAEAPAATTEQTRPADTQIDVTQVGGVMPAPDAMATIDVTNAGGVAPAPQAIQQTVTAPVTGYEQPVADMRTEVDVNTAGETIGENYIKGDWANTTAAKRAQARTFASLRLARLRLSAGIDSGDDISLAQRIAASNTPDSVIRAEIDTLSKVQRTAAQAPRRATAGRQQAVRNVPSLVSTAAPVVHVPAPSMTPTDDEFLFS